MKFRVSAMLGFQSFENARTVLAGIELIQKLKKGQYGMCCISAQTTIASVIVPADQAAPRIAPNTHACPWRLYRVIPSTCPFLMMFAAPIPCITTAAVAAVLGHCITRRPY